MNDTINNAIIGALLSRNHMALELLECHEHFLIDANRLASLAGMHYDAAKERMRRAYQEGNAAAVLMRAAEGLPVD